VRAVRATARRTSARIVPVTPERWPDLEALFGEKGACAGCWCMWMRLPAAAFRRGKGAGNRRALRALVAKRPPGLLAYVGGEPVGWVAVAPREEYLRLENSRVLEPVEGERVWAAPCFFIRASHRGAGLTASLLQAAAAHAARSGAHAIEGYPTVNRAERQSPAFVWTGFESTFRRAGFEEIARRSPTRPILRKALRRSAGATPKPRPQASRKAKPRTPTGSGSEPRTARRAGQRSRHG
jgi:GNAT superfamily N-acetyltransferase